MRLLQAMAGAEFGGAEAFFERLAIALHRAGLEQRILVRPNGRRCGRLREAGLDVVELPFGGPLDLRTRWGFHRAIGQFKPSLSLTWMNRASQFCPKAGQVRVGRLGGYYDLKYYKGFDHLIGNTRDIRAWIVDQGWPGDRAHYLPNFVSAATAAPFPREEVYTPMHAPLVLAMGRLHANKGFDTLLRALAKAPGVYLWLAGEGPEREALELLAERLSVKPRVRFLGWRDDPASLFAAADVFVCSSRHEPLGNVVIEAWAQTIPVIATESQGPASLVSHEKTGLLVPIDDEVAMGAAIERLFRDRGLARTLGLAGRLAYEAEFTEATVVDHYLGFFDSVTR